MTTFTFLRRIEPEPNSGCWLWTGSLRQGSGYGQLRIDRFAERQRFKELGA